MTLRHSFRRRFAVACAALIGSVVHSSMSLADEQASQEGSLTMEAAVQLALKQSPRLISPSAEVAVAQAELSGASRLQSSNPQLQGAIGPRMRDSAEDGLDIEVGIFQRLEIYGQRGARKRSAELVLSAEKGRFEAQRVALAAEVRQGFSRVLAADRLLVLSNEAHGLAQEGLRAAEARFASGAVSRIEVNAARGELGRAARDQAIAAQRRLAAMADLRTLLGVDSHTALAPIGELDQLAPPPSGGVDALTKLAMSQRADVAAAHRQLEAERATGKAASRDAIPAPSIGVKYAEEEDAQIVQGTLAFELPIFQRNQGPRGIAQARIREAEGLLAAVERSIQIEVATALEQHRAARAAAEAFAGGTVAALEENASLVTEAYRAGKVSFLELLVIRRESLDARRAYIEALQDLHATSAQLKRAIGSIQ